MYLSSAEVLYRQLIIKLYQRSLSIRCQIEVQSSLVFTAKGASSCGTSGKREAKRGACLPVCNNVSVLLFHLYS